MAQKKQNTLNFMNFESGFLNDFAIFSLKIFQNSHTRSAMCRRIAGHGKEIALTLNTSSQKTVLVKYGISYVSHDAAYNNLKKEIPGWDFQNIKENAQAAWNDHLGRVRILDAEPTNADEQAALLDRKQVFYSALYRASLGPNLFSDLPFDNDDNTTS